MNFHTRRQFLQRMAMVGGAVSCLPLLHRVRASDPPAKPKHVLIVGAGLAGLVAAYELELKGHKVTILEADAGHVGGRVRTRRFADGKYGELGAMRIPVKHDLTRNYIKQFNLTLRPFVNLNLEAFVVARGKKVRRKDWAELSAEYKLAKWEAGKSSDALWELAVTQVWKKLKDAELKDLFAVTPATKTVRKLDRLTHKQLFEKAGLSEEAIEYLSVTQSEESLLHTAATELLRDEVLDVYSDGLDEIVGGTDLLPKAFEEHLKSKPKRGCVVTEIRNKETGVEACYTENGKEKIVQGDYLICTIPFPVLDRVNFVPALSAGKQRAIRTLHYESATKVLLNCDERFWETNDDIFGGGTLTDLPTGMTYYPSDNAIAKDPLVSDAGGVLLASYNWGMHARRLAAGPASETVKHVVRHLSTIHPDVANKGMIKDSAVWSWDQHRWTGGAFCWFMPGQHTELHKYILEPEERVLFAGEHVSLSHTWMQGALESGLRAVQIILNNGVPPKNP